MPEIAPIHVVGVLVAIALFYQSFKLVRTRKESTFEFLLWTGFGTAILFLSLESMVTTVDLTEFLRDGLRVLGFESGMNGILTVAILAILLMLFYTYVNAKNNRKDIYDIDQELAILRYEQNQEGHEDRRPNESRESVEER